MISKVATKTTSCGKIKVKKTHSQKTFPGVPDQAGLKGLTQNQKFKNSLNNVYT